MADIVNHVSLWTAAGGHTLKACRLPIGEVAVGQAGREVVFTESGCFRCAAPAIDDVVVVRCGQLFQRRQRRGVRRTSGCESEPELLGGVSAARRRTSEVISAAALVWVVVRAARAEGASLDLPGIRAAGRAGIPLVVRTLTLRAALLVTTDAVVAGATGVANQTVDVATHQLTMTLWGFLALVLDAIAIAAQAITGRYLGAGDVTGTRAVTAPMIRWES